MSRQNLIGMQICEGAAGKWSMVQVWNPANSGLNFFLEKIVCQWNAMASVQAALSNLLAYDFDFDTSPIGRDADVRYLQDKNAGCVTSSAIQLRTLQSVGAFPTSRIIYEWWVSPMGKSQPEEFNPPLILPPGNGIEIRHAQFNVYSIVSVQGYTDAVV